MTNFSEQGTANSEVVSNHYVATSLCHYVATWLLAIGLVVMLTGCSYTQKAKLQRGGQTENPEDVKKMAQEIFLKERAEFNKLYSRAAERREEQWKDVKAKEIKTVDLTPEDKKNKVEQKWLVAMDFMIRFRSGARSEKWSDWSDWQKSRYTLLMQKLNKKWVATPIAAPPSSR